MHPAVLVRAVQAEGGDRNVECLARGGGDHVVGAYHEARRRPERRAGGVFEALARLQQWPFANHPIAIHVLGLAARIGNPPGAAQQLHRFAALIFDLYAIGPNVVALVRLRLILEIIGPDGNTDAACGLCIIVHHGTTEVCRFLWLIQGGLRRLVQRHHSAALGRDTEPAADALASSACARSSIRSRGSSRPTESRIAPSVMPSRARSASPMRMCVVVAGCVASDLESPRLFETAINPNAFMAANAAGLPPATSKVTTVPPPDISAIANSCCG